MSTEREQVRLLAERIARRVSQGKSFDGDGALRVDNRDRVGSELAAMRASLEELRIRLARIESDVTEKRDYTYEPQRGVQSDDESQGRFDSQRSKQTSGSLRSPWLSGMYMSAAHPSQERFGVEEAAVAELVDFFEGEKRCELEPGGKPCDHCAMCSSRGF